MLNVAKAQRTATSDGVALDQGTVSDFEGQETAGMEAPVASQPRLDLYRDRGATAAVDGDHVASAIPEEAEGITDSNMPLAPALALPSSGVPVDPTPIGSDPDTSVAKPLPRELVTTLPYSRPTLSLTREVVPEVPVAVDVISANIAAVTADARPHAPGTGRRRLDEPTGTGIVRFEGDTRWSYDARDGFWTDETEQERASRVRASFESYFERENIQGVDAAPSAFEQPFLGFGGADRMPDLQKLITDLHDYDVLLFRRGGPLTSFRDA